MLERLRYFIPLAFIITALSGLIYLTGQQILRLGANDPQIQISEDIAGRLGQSATFPPFPSSNAIDIAKSLNTFIMILDDQGKQIYSSASLDGKLPSVPSGVFDYARSHNQSRITWQPKPNVRSAIVITKFGDKSKGFALVGRSLREVEEREEDLAKVVGLGWIVTMIGAFISNLAFIPQKNTASKPKNKK